MAIANKQKFLKISQLWQKQIPQKKKSLYELNWIFLVAKMTKITLQKKSDHLSH
jgi:hypothetical protein